MTRALIVLILLSAPALADTKTPAGQSKLTGPKLHALVRALKHNGAKSEHPSEFKWTFVTKTLTCNYSDEDDDKLGSYDCVLDGKKLGAGGSALLTDALETAGIDAIYGMARQRFNVMGLTCLNDRAAHSDDLVYVCTYVAGK